MRITIDTKEDSHDEIKNAIKILSNLVGESALSNAGLEKEEPVKESEDSSGNVFGNIFDNASSEPNIEDEVKEQEIKPEKKEEEEYNLVTEIPQMEEYFS